MDLAQRDFNTIIKAIQDQDGRYQRPAYYFLRQALDYTIKQNYSDSELSSSQHISGQELLEGIRSYALEEYGPMAYFLFKNWGVHSCSDFGNIVFNLVDSHVLGKTDTDSPEDFKEGYDFKKAFLTPFAPKSPVTQKKPRLY
ncbi:MAG: hypothetical protein CML12_03060 [Puniceicoccaceae bacterium]|nr:hypothetical protein [Puniceicoccaceae bacterium]RCL30120.1 MAG: hypothetical protein DBX03_02890 [Puniceicoccaceae bacterium]|tara:strand:+ start:124 stop:549 length:426 start_codon:yes stop_codon:yes gene_type:complete